MWGGDGEVRVGLRGWESKMVGEGSGVCKVEGLGFVCIGWGVVCWVRVVYMEVWGVSWLVGISSVIYCVCCG